MSGPRRQARELALQCLYQIDQTKNPDADLELIQVNFQAPKKAMGFATILVEGVKAHLEELDGLIETHSENWKISRMSVVDRNLLRMAFYEFLYCADVPQAVSLHEIIEIAKRFSTDEGPAFINGILDSYCTKNKPSA
jgi:N utilization substance protein B